MTESRLIRMATHDAVVGSLLLPTGGGFEVDVGNVFRQFGQTAVGFSVESVGFYNLEKIVTIGKSDRFLIDVPSAGVNTFVVSILPANYDIAGLIQAVEDELNALPTPLTFTVAEAGTHLLISATGDFTIYAEGVPAKVDYFSVVQRGIVGNRLLTTLGFGAGSAEYYDSSGGVLVSLGAYDLGGQRVAFLHSSFLIHNRQSVDGEGVAVAMFCSCPITVPYGSFNQVYPNQYEDTAVTWGRVHEIRNINLRLRDLRGELIDVEGTEWYVTLRVFLS